MEFTPQELWEHTGTPVRIVIFTMFFMALACMYVAIERAWVLYNARSQSRLLSEAINSAMAQGNTEEALNISKDEAYKRSYLGHMLIAGLTEFTARPDIHGLHASERALESVFVSEGSELRQGMNILATTGATAPFVGLVGTIFGIINAFAGMAEAGGGGLGAVSAGIAEALVTTAIGISVAILGVWLFNFYTAMIDSITKDMTMSTQEFINWMHNQILSQPDAAQ